MNKKTIITFLALLVFTFLQGQDSTLPYWREVQAFKKLDSNALPPKGAVLLIGSSSFTKWVDAQEYFPDRDVVNRAFGGSSLPDLIRYVDDIVFPYQPAQVVIYCGENDLAASDTVTAQMVFDRFKTLFNLIRQRMPNVPIAFVSIKPSPSRERFWPKVREANALIKKWMKTKKATGYIDVYYKMFYKNGHVMSDIFIEDRLHMNAKGYAIWQKAIEPYLIKNKN